MDAASSTVATGSRPGVPRQGVWASWVVLAASLAVALAAWSDSRRHVDLHMKAEFDSQVAEIRGKLDERIAAHIRVLRSAAALFAVAGPVSRDGWQRFAAAQELDHHYPAIAALAFARQVEGGDLDAFVAEMRASGIRDFAVRPSGRRERYVVNAYSEPFVGSNIRALGYDMWQDADRRVTMQRAAETDLPTITERVTLRIDEATNPVPAFIMYLPVRLDGRLYGYVLSPFRMPSLMQDLLGRNADYLTLTVYDGTEPAPERLFYRSAADEAPPRLTARHVLEVGGRQWTLDFASRPGLESETDTGQPRTVLMVGLSFSLLLFAVTWSLGRTKDRAEAIARERTRSLTESRARLEDGNRRLERQAEQLRRSNAELEQFAYVASHDLQEPLRMISSYAQLIARRYGTSLDDEAREFIGFMVDGTSRMQAMILDLLEYSRIGRKEEAPAEMEAAHGVEVALRNLSLTIAKAGATVDCGPLPRIRVRPHQFVALMQNLIGNAVKYRHPERPPRVEVSARRLGDQWEFAVADNGIGIQPEYFDRIFMIFQRLHTRDKYEGSGIGLAICKKIVEHHEGRIRVESAPGSGSTFFFTLPA